MINKSKYRKFYWVPCKDETANASFKDKEGNVIQEDTQNYFRLYGVTKEDNRDVLVDQGRAEKVDEWEKGFGAIVGPSPYPHLDNVVKVK